MLLLARPDASGSIWPKAGAAAAVSVLMAVLSVENIIAAQRNWSLQGVLCLGLLDCNDRAIR